MASPSHAPFSAPDAPGDATFALVLLEGSGAIQGNWDDIRNYYLPQLLGALWYSTQPEAPVQVTWQLSADPYDYSAGASTVRSTYSNVHREIPDFRFDPSTHTPLSPTTLRRSIETIRAHAPRDRSSTRHLIVVAMSQPLATSPGLSQPNVFSSADTWQSIAQLLHQERVRLHMILHASPQLAIFHEFFYNALTVQSRAEAPLWFQVNPSHAIHLSAKMMSFGAGESPTHISSSAPPSVPVTPNATTSSLPLSSPGYETTGSSMTLSASPPTRRPRPKGKETVPVPPPSADASGPQLVNYIKQIHGLTKKRTPGGKAAKKSGAADAPRASTSRPILPRLELPSSNISPSTDPKGKTTERAVLEAASSGGSRYAPIAPALGPTRSAPAEDRGPQHRRWPWLQPAPVTAATMAQEAGLSQSTAATLRSLQAIAPRMPVTSTHLSGEQQQQQSPPRGRRGTAGDAHTSHSGTGISTSPPPHRQTTYPPHAMSPPMQAAAMQGSQAVYHTTAGSHAPFAGGYQPQAFASYAPTGGAIVSSSPSTGGSAPSPEDLENQPFVITPEYEALANAEFEHAVRSGAMQASMTPTTMSPVVTSPGMHPGTGGYFPSDPVGSATVMSPSMQQTPTLQSRAAYANAPYQLQHDPQVTHDVMYHQGQVPSAASTSPSSSPPGNIQYYDPNSPPGNDPSQARRWYG